jgi:DNA-binding transcriptional MerR regulator
MSDLLDIAEVARRSGLSIGTLHTWERHGVIAPAARSGLRRQYEPEVLTTIALAVVGQRSGFTLAEIAELLRAGLRSDTFRVALAARLEQLRQRRAELDAAIVGLEHALTCEEPDPLCCPTFVAQLADVLPRRE